MIYRLLVLCSVLPLLTLAQEPSLLNNQCLSVDTLEDQGFRELLQSYLVNTQFIMVGEQHFIQEAAHATKIVYALAEDYGYHTLCIETDALMAQKIHTIASAADPVQTARAFYQKFPISIPFYENKEDWDLLSFVAKSGGQLWGIDQTLMSQFRFNFHHLLNNATDDTFAKALESKLKAATNAYEEAIANKAFQSIYYFQYDSTTHHQLMKLATTPAEREIVHQLGKTKEIYDYNLMGQYYLNNETRGQLMKANFMRYYQEASLSTPLPKVVFKLGASHTYRGLTPTRIYDISNLASELSNMNGMSSLHLKVLGITGQQTVGFPFAPEPIINFDNTEDFPSEIQEWLAQQDAPKKYNIFHLAPLRSGARQYSEAMQDLMFAHDIFILVRDAQPVSTF